MNKFILTGVACLLVLSGCKIQGDTSNEDKLSDYITIATDSYYLANQQLAIIDNPDSQQGHISYLVKDEMELAKVVQYNLENGEAEFAYQSNVEINLDDVLEFLSRLNPFDISIKQTSSIPKSDSEDSDLNMYFIKIENLDKKYLENIHEAKKIVEKLQLDKKGINEKLEAIHKYILENSEYDNAQDSQLHSESFSAYGVFMKHKAVCTGYSRAFMMLAKEANIPALFVVSEKMNHSWNYIFDGKICKYIDTTWDDISTGADTKKYLEMDVNSFMKEGKHVFDDHEDTLMNTLLFEFFTK